MFSRNDVQYIEQMAHIQDRALRPYPGEENPANAFPKCPTCNAPLRAVSYTIWGTKRFEPQRALYVEDEAPGNTDMEFRCPTCSAKIDPEGIIF